ncbi:MAG: transporter permease [Naasia sp.]|uniref:ABC transporter permease n=1 Tax=Naasia sp. TaxID=2546198 RepID=UPI002624D451|nr:ABC transporter permease [Naasia sp.]MCU1570166.1 transporter permease [Naasia sp.]
MTLTLAERVARTRLGPPSSWLRRNGAVVFVYLLVVVLYAVAASISPAFGRPENLAEILRQSIALGVVTIGQVYVLLGGGIDMSVGMTARVVGLGVAVTMGATTIPPILVIVLGLAVGAAIGLLNGVLITRIGATPFIVTLGMLGVLSGVALAITDGPTDVVPDFFFTMYDAAIGPVPIAVLVFLLIWAAAWFVLNRTTYGRNVYAVGGSADVARLSAINVHRTRTLTYVISGVCAAAAGIFLLSRSGVGDPGLGQGLEFSSIVAAAIGGISLYGGRGSIVGAFGAVLLVTMSSNIFDFLHVNGYFQQLVLGAIVLVGVSVYRTRGRQ